MGLEVLEGMESKPIAKTIDLFLEKECLDPSLCVSKGNDSCSAMAGKKYGVEKKLQQNYKKGLNFHCVSHHLNLVIIPKRFSRNSKYFCHNRRHNKLFQTLH